LKVQSAGVLFTGSDRGGLCGGSWSDLQVTGGKGHEIRRSRRRRRSGEEEEQEQEQEEEEEEQEGEEEVLKAMSNLSCEDEKEERTGVFAAGTALLKTLKAIDVHKKYSASDWESKKRNSIAVIKSQSLTGQQSMSNVKGVYMITHEGGLKWYLDRLKNRPAHGRNLKEVYRNTGLEDLVQHEIRSDMCLVPSCV
jgi:hypothetical protein